MQVFDLKRSHLRVTTNEDITVHYMYMYMALALGLTREVLSRYQLNGLSNEKVVQMKVFQTIYGEDSFVQTITSQYLLSL